MKLCQQLEHRGSLLNSIVMHHAHAVRSEASGVPGSTHSEQCLGSFSPRLTPTLNLLRQRAHLRMKTLTFSLAPATVGAALASELVLAGRLGGGDGTGKDTGDASSSHEKYSVSDSSIQTAKLRDCVKYERLAGRWDRLYQLRASRPRCGRPMESYECQQTRPRNS